jgi:hypothetical protein
MLEITKTPEWRDLLDQMQLKLAKYRENMEYKARNGDILDIKRAVGEFDGFRQSIEFVRSLGVRE